MVKFTYQQLNNQNFHMAVSRLANYPLPARVAYNVKKWADKIMQARTKISEEYNNDVLNAFAEKGEDGKIKLAEPGNPGSYTIPEAVQADYQKALDAFGEREYTFDRQPILIEDLPPNFNISASDLSALDKLLGERETQAEQVPHLAAVPTGTGQ
jgi:hypothetical protein